MKKQIVLATGNSHKVDEFKQIFKEFDFIPQSDLNVVNAQETGLSFVENALIKARNASINTKFPVLADDSGLVVDCLNGAPGIYSARYAGVNASDADNNNLLLKNLKSISNLEDRKAYFVCVLVYLRYQNDPMPIISQGVSYGQILHQIQGEQGFGYDPLFFVPKLSKTFAQLSVNEKNTLSHRARAVAKLQKILVN